jgi:uncharacterized membrane protein YdbT with pleckstrin-like domain
MLHKILANPLPGEKPVLLVRRHWFVLFQRILRFVGMLLLPFLVLGVLGLSGVEIGTGPGAPLFGIIALGILIYSAALWLSLFTAWLDYSLDVWLVTNYRIISVEQFGLFSRTLSEQRLDRIQDITSEVHGFIRTIVGYGNVHIQTAGEHPRFVLKQIPHPAAIARRIIELQNDAIARNRGEANGLGAPPIPQPPQPPQTTQKPLRG